MGFTLTPRRGVWCCDVINHIQVNLRILALVHTHTVVHGCSCCRRKRARGPVQSLHSSDAFSQNCLNAVCQDYHQLMYTQTRACSSAETTSSVLILQLFTAASPWKWVSRLIFLKAQPYLADTRRDVVSQPAMAWANNNIWLRCTPREFCSHWLFHILCFLTHSV